MHSESQARYSLLSIILVAAAVALFIVLAVVSARPAQFGHTNNMPTQQPFACPKIRKSTRLTKVLGVDVFPLALMPSVGSPVRDEQKIQVALC